MKNKPYTVIGLCECGCDNSFCEHVRASCPVKAEKLAVKDRIEEGFPSRVIGVFEGHLPNVRNDEQ